MIPRILSKPLKFAKSFFLLGPRGTGKTHWVKTNLPNALYLNLLKASTYTELLAEPSRLRLLIPNDFQDWIVIDEVQKIPELLNEVHDLIEEKKYKFVLTGSSARSLRKKGVNLLAGRAIMYPMHPLTVNEMGEKFDLQHALAFGHLPATLTEPDPKAYLKTYINLYIREEVLQEGLTRNIAAFSRFLEAASFSQGSPLNMSSIARDASIHQKVITSYFDILEDLLIAVRIPVFTKHAKRNLVAHPKFYFFDLGVYKILRPKSIMDIDSQINGAALETLVLQELRALNDCYDLEYNIYYWRTQSGIEIDFVMYGPHGLHAFEIKHTNKFSRKDCKGLRAFSADYPLAKLYLLYAGDEHYYFDNVSVIPFVEAIRNLKKYIEPGSDTSVRESH